MNVLFKTFTLERYILVFQNYLHSFQVYDFEDYSGSRQSVIRSMFGNSLELFGTRYTGLSSTAMILLFFLKSFYGSPLLFGQNSNCWKVFPAQSSSASSCLFLLNFGPFFEGFLLSYLCIFFSFTSDMKYLPSLHPTLWPLTLTYSSGSGNLS